MIDVICLALLYSVRVLAGGVSAHIVLSHWLVTFSMFVFASLALVKRYTEINAMAKASLQHGGRAYRPTDLSIISMFGVSTGVLSTLILVLYVTSPEVQVLYRFPKLLLLACPILLYWFGRLWILTGRDEMHHDPVVFGVWLIRRMQSARKSREGRGDAIQKAKISIFSAQFSAPRIRTITILRRRSRSLAGPHAAVCCPRKLTLPKPEGWGLPANFAKARAIVHNRCRGLLEEFGAHSKRFTRFAYAILLRRSSRSGNAIFSPEPVRIQSGSAQPRSALTRLSGGRKVSLLPARPRTWNACCHRPRAQMKNQHLQGKHLRNWHP